MNIIMLDLKMKAPQLYVPKKPVFPDLLNNDQHVVYVDFGLSSSKDFIDDSSISSSGVESGVIIPFLSDSPNGPPKYSIAMAELYSRDRVEPAKPNIMYPFISIDEMTVEDNEAFWRNGDEELHVSFVKSNPCQTPSAATKEVFVKFFTGLSLLGWSEPDLEMCNRHPTKNYYCSVMNTIKDDVEEALPNVCQTYDIADVVECAASFDIIEVTPGFREFLLINDNAIDIIAAERFYCNATTTFKFPCVE
ncbi:hypothetical protein HOLleu_38495 [Holothuria leucospilota]|uniref:Uncharacterized protein n=1 Tax=Holothuria leucospilota TaxID=206669 RepID=A0A9Q0YIS3_HOLLE|nr:hypothetical protein HOLleu_38495 [Holothuria leucospilota]